MIRNLLFLLFSLLVLSCSQPTPVDEHPPGDAIGFSTVIEVIKASKSEYAFLFDEASHESDTLISVSGTIHSEKLKSFRLLEMTAASKGRAITVPLEEDGSFTKELVLTNEGYYQLEIGPRKYDVYLIPGHDLSFSYDRSEKSNPLKFDDVTAPVNSYIRQDIALKLSMLPKSYELNRLDFEIFTDTLRAIKTMREELLDKLYYLKAGLPEGLRQFRLAQVNYGWAMAHLNRQKKDRENPEAAGYLEEINLNDATALISPKFREFIEAWFDQQVKSNNLDVISGDPLSGPAIAGKYTKIYNHIGKCFKDETVAGYIKTNVVNDMIKETGTSAVNDLVMRFRKEIKNENYLAAVNRQYERYVMVDDGALAPDFEAYDLEGNIVKLSDFLGKYVYIDVWASWCSPCKHEMPYFEKLKEEFKTKNIEFVSISIDKTQDIWKNAVAEHNMKGTQLYAKGEWNSALVKKYEMRGLPQFILIDTKGQIINLLARRPSGSVRNDLAMLH